VIVWACTALHDFAAEALSATGVLKALSARGLGGGESLLGLAAPAPGGGYLQGLRPDPWSLSPRKPLP